MKQGNCARCGRFGNINKHHMIPVKWMGTNKPNKIVLLCLSCHRKEHIKLSPLRYCFDNLWWKLEEYAPPEFFFNLTEKSVREICKSVGTIRTRAEKQEMQKIKKIIKTAKQAAAIYGGGKA